MGTAAAPALQSKSLALDTTSKVPLYAQLHAALCRALQEEIFAPGTRLPTLQELATSLQVSRNTVRRAIHQLVSEGRVHGDPTTGYFATGKPAGSTISEKISSKDTKGSALPALPAKDTSKAAVVLKANAGPTPGKAPIKPAPPVPVPALAPATALPAETPKYTFSRPAILEQIDKGRLQASGVPRPFRPGFPETREFPLGIWEDLRARLLRERSGELLDFTGTFGYMPLREAVASRLRNARGVKCFAEQVIITAGAQQALNLVVDTLVSPGDVVGVEEPGYYGAKAAFQRAGAKVTPLLVDEEGLIVPDAKRQNHPKLIYATPTSQFPLGAPLTLPRRLALLDYAAHHHTWILEDDSDGDFCYYGRPLPSLQGADNQSRVLYFGTTGKSLFPSLEIGYLVVPLGLLESFAKTKEISGGAPCVIDQATLALFLSEGHFDRHIQRVNVVYHQRLQALSDSVQTELDGYIQLEPTQGGLQAIGWLNRNVSEDVIVNCANTAGVDLPLLSSYGRTALVRPGVVFGFASFSEGIIRDSIKALGQALRTSQKQRALLPPPDDDDTTAEKYGFLRRLFNRRK